jgi:hypothetical protein
MTKATNKQEPARRELPKAPSGIPGLDCGDVACDAGFSSSISVIWSWDSSGTTREF